MNNVNLRSGILSYPLPSEEHAALLLGWRTRPDITKYLLILKRRGGGSWPARIGRISTID